MSGTKPPAEVLADELDRLYDQLDPVDDWRPAISDSGEMLRRIPALEAERDKLRAECDLLIQTLKMARGAILAERAKAAP